MCLHDHDLADASFYELRWCTKYFVHTGIDNEPLSGNVCRTVIVYAGVKYERNYLFFNSCFELAVFFSFGIQIDLYRWLKSTLLEIDLSAK